MAYPYINSYMRVEETRVIFRVPGEEIMLEGVDVNALSEILLLCDGYHTIEEILLYSTSRKIMKEQECLEVMRILYSHRILVEVHDLYVTLHEASSNPMPYVREVDDEEARGMVRQGGQTLLSEVNADPKSLLTALLQKRVSSRTFESRASLSAKTFRELLWAMYGVTSNGRYTVPSAGGLYTLDLLTVPLNVEGFDVAVYKCTQGDFVCASPLSEPKHIFESLFWTDNFEGIPALILIIGGDLRRISRKYSNRAYRYALLEAGHMAQNAYLLAAERDLPIIEVGGYNDDLISSMYPSGDFIALTSLLIGGES